LRQYSFNKKLQSPTVIREKLRKGLLYKKVALKMLIKLRPKLFCCVEVIDETFEVTLFRLGSCSVSAHQARDEQEEEEGGQSQDADNDVDVVLLVPHLKCLYKFTARLSSGPN